MTPFQNDKSRPDVLKFLREDQRVKDGRIYEWVWSGWTITPEIPKNLKDIDGYGNAKAKFTRTEIPDYIKSGLNMDAPTVEQKEFILREDSRIYKDGYWCFIKNKITWITPWHYLALNYWLPKVETKDKFVEYRNKQRLILLFCWYVYKHTADYGVTYLKGRRDGATMYQHLMAYWFATLRPEQTSGLIASDLKLALTNFRRFLFIPISKLPKWLRYTMQPNKDLITFSEPSSALRASKKNKEGLASQALNSIIRLEPSTEMGFDGDEINFLGKDEAGKDQRTDINVFWSIQEKTLINMGRKIGFAFLPTTANKIEKGGGNYKILFDDADISTKEDGLYPTTTNKLRNLFFPAYIGQPGFVGPYGEDVVEMPDAEQECHMREMWPKDGPPFEVIGAKAFLERNAEQKRKKREDLYWEEKRQNPFTPGDAFSSLNQFCPYESTKLDGLKQSASAPSVQAQIRRGYFQNRGQGTEIVPVWREDPKGPWERGPWEPSAETIGQYKVQYGMRRPLNHKVGCIGLDTYAKSDVKGRGSNQGLSGRLFFNRKYEDANKAFRASYGSNMPGYFHTPAKFAYYAHRHPQSGWDHEQVMLCALYYSMPISLENNRSEAFQNYMIQHGMGGFMLREYEILNVPMTRENDVIGLFTGNEINRDGHISKGCEYTNEFLRGDGVWLGPHTYDIVEEPMRFPFLKGIQDHLDFDLTDRTKSDYSMADNMASVAEWNICGWGDEFGYLSTHYTTPEKGIRPGFFVTRRRA